MVVDRCVDGTEEEELFDFDMLATFENPRAAKSVSGVPVGAVFDKVGKVEISEEIKSSYTSLKVHGREVVKCCGSRLCFVINFQ
jgi:hypothetical protein